MPPKKAVVKKDEHDPPSKPSETSFNADDQIRILLDQLMKDKVEERHKRKRFEEERARERKCFEEEHA